jgi:hypothetical protein
MNIAEYQLKHTEKESKSINTIITVYNEGIK